MGIIVDLKLDLFFGVTQISELYKYDKIRNNEFIQIQIFELYFLYKFNKYDT